MGIHVIQDRLPQVSNKGEIQWLTLGILNKRLFHKLAGSKIHVFHASMLKKSLDHYEASGQLPLISKDREFQVHSLLILYKRMVHM